MIDQIKKLVAPIQRRILMAIARGVINTVDDAKGIQKLQVSLLTDEVIDRLERIQQYGFSSAPLPGSEAVALFIGGNRDHGVVIATDDRRYRKKNLENGEVALYTDQGDYIHFKRGGEIDILASTKVKVTAPNIELIASTKVTITSPSVEMSGALQVSGNISAGGNVAATGNIAGVNITGSGVVSGATVQQGSLTMTAIKTGYNSHTHTAPSGGGTTTVPSPSV